MGDPLRLLVARALRRRCRGWLALQLPQQRTERLLRKLDSEDPLDFLTQPFANAVEALPHQIRPARPHIGFDLRRELAPGSPALQHPDEFFRIAAAERSSPALNGFGVACKGLLEHSQAHTGVVQPPHQHFEARILPVRGHHLQQLQPIINVQALVILFLVNVDGEKRVAFVGPKNQLTSQNRAHLRARLPDPRSQKPTWLAALHHPFSRI